jgi:hypothetical protein
LEYALTWAKDGRDEKLVKAAKANKLPIPKAILDKPTIRDWDLLYWDCFMDLCSTRQLVHGLGYIPWPAVNDWASRHTVNNADEFEVLRYVVWKMDEWWVNFFRERKG